MSAGAGAAAARQGEKAEKLLRLMLGALVLWDLGLAVWSVGFPRHFEDFTIAGVNRTLGVTVPSYPIYTRGTGMYWGFAAWFQFLGARDPRKFVTAVQLATVFRILATVIDSAELAFLMPGPWYHFHYMLLFFVVANVAIAAIQIGCLKKMGLPWLDTRPG